MEALVLFACCGMTPTVPGSESVLVDAFLGPLRPLSSKSHVKEQPLRAEGVRLLDLDCRCGWLGTAGTLVGTVSEELEMSVARM